MKTINRLVAITFAAIISMAMPMKVLACEETLSPVPEVEEEKKVADELIQKASEEVVDISEEEIEVILAEAQDYIDATEQNLTVDTDETGATADEELEIVLTKTGEADAIVAAVVEKDPETDQNIVGSAINQVSAAEAFLDDAKETINETADSAIAQAGVANNTADRDEAYAAAEKAAQDVEKAEADLQVAVDEYNKADEELQKVQDELAAAKELYDEADAALLNATQSLTNAEDNAAKAVEKMAAAQAKINALEKQANDLTELKEQYYDMMVWYFRNCSGGAAVYKNGELDVAASAAKISQEKVDNNAKSISKNLIPLTRYVTNLLVDYMLTSEGATDITFGQDGNQNGCMQAGALTKDAKGNDRVLLNTDNGAAETTSITWHQTGNGDYGRSNYVVVTYRDKNGKDQEIKVNYVLKNSAYNEEGIANGIFYLAEIRNVNGEVVIDRIVNDNNFDDYQKLCETYEALSDLKEYEEAAKAVAAAAEEVAKFKAEIDKLQNLTVDRAQLVELQKKLDDAQSKLDATKIVKEGLEEHVVQARKIVEGIDLSRFAVVVVPADEASVGIEADSGNNNNNIAAVVAVAKAINAIPADSVVAQTAAPAADNVMVDDAINGATSQTVKGTVLGKNRSGTTQDGKTNRRESVAQRKNVVTTERSKDTDAQAQDTSTAATEAREAYFAWWWLFLPLVAKKLYDSCKRRRSK